jgi:hypothetical protein
MYCLLFPYIILLGLCASIDVAETKTRLPPPLSVLESKHKSFNFHSFIHHVSHPLCTLFCCESDKNSENTLSFIHHVSHPLCTLFCCESDKKQRKYVDMATWRESLAFSTCCFWNVSYNHVLNFPSSIRILCKCQCFNHKFDRLHTVSWKLICT